jgi:hypothetical protein
MVAGSDLLSSQYNNIIIITTQKCRFEGEGNVWILVATDYVVNYPDQYTMHCLSKNI